MDKHIDNGNNIKTDHGRKFVYKLHVYHNSLMSHCHPATVMSVNYWECYYTSHLFMATVGVFIIIIIVESSNVFPDLKFKLSLLFILAKFQTLTGFKLVRMLKCKQGLYTPVSMDKLLLFV